MCEHTVMASHSTKAFVLFGNKDYCEVTLEFFGDPFAPEQVVVRVGGYYEQAKKCDVLAFINGATHILETEDVSECGGMRYYRTPSKDGKEMGCVIRA